MKKILKKSIFINDHELVYMVEYSEIARPVTYITVFSRAWLFEIVELKLTNI